ncbi:MAG: hypothetical protein JXX14_04570 [Deltaproteobacteria bacterium]|nr:hypothetical protein [Deltaproteobacteria bacterium]
MVQFKTVFMTCVPVWLSLLFTGCDNVDAGAVATVSGSDSTALTDSDSQHDTASAAYTGTLSESGIVTDPTSGNVMDTTSDSGDSMDTRADGDTVTGGEFSFVSDEASDDDFDDTADTAIGSDADSAADTATGSDADSSADMPAGSDMEAETDLTLYIGPCGGYRGDTAGSAPDAMIRFTYSEQGEILRLENYPLPEQMPNEFNSERGDVTQFSVTYDDQGRVVMRQEINSMAGSPVYQTLSYLYKHTYDDLGQVIEWEKTVESEGTGAAKTEKYYAAYDWNTRMISLIHITVEHYGMSFLQMTGRRYEYTYDNDGNMLIRLQYVDLTEYDYSTFELNSGDDWMKSHEFDMQLSQMDEYSYDPLNPGVLVSVTETRYEATVDGPVIADTAVYPYDGTPLDSPPAPLEPVTARSAVAAEFGMKNMTAETDEIGNLLTLSGCNDDDICSVVIFDYSCW